MKKKIVKLDTKVLLRQYQDRWEQMGEQHIDEKVVSLVNEILQSYEDCENENENITDQLAEKNTEYKELEEAMDEKVDIDTSDDDDIYRNLATRFGYGSMNEYDKIEQFLTTLK